MTDTTLKNPLEGTMQSVADLANSVIASVKVKPFVQQYDECEAHGKYPINVQDEHGIERWYPGCPICRKQKQVARLLTASNIPKRFVACDFTNYEVATEEQKRVLHRCEGYAKDFAKYRESGACLLLCGRKGTGKNHLASAIIRHLLDTGYSVLRIKASQYLDAYWSKSFDERETWLNGMANVDLLMIDEIGRSSQAKAAQDAFFRLLDARYEAQLPNLLTTNLNREELIEVLGDAAYDRLTQGGSIRLTFDWESMRGKI